MRGIKRIALAAAVSAAVVVGVAALLASTPSYAAGPPGQENCNKPCKQWQVINGFKCKFVGCDIEGICRYLC